MSAAVRRSLPGDEEALRLLWKTVFGDSDLFLDAFFRLVYRPGMAAAAVEDGKIVSAAYAIPFENAVYIYAVATHPAYRGRGLGQLVTLTAADGKPAYLYPAETSLRDWYARAMGAATVSLRPAFRAERPLRRLTASEYNEARETLLAGIPHAVYPLYVLELFGANGSFWAGENSVWALENGVVKESLPCLEGGEPFVMGINGASSLYWGLVLD